MCITTDLLHRENSAPSWTSEDAVYPFLMINSHRILTKVDRVLIPTWWSPCKKTKVLQVQLPESACYRGNGQLHSFAELLPGTAGAAQRTILLFFAKEINVHHDRIDKNVVISCHTELMLDYMPKAPCADYMHEVPCALKKRKRTE